MKYCQVCSQPVHIDGPAYCSEACWAKAAARRRAIGARRARQRRDAISAAANAHL